MTKERDFGNVVKHYNRRKGIYASNGQVLIERGIYENTIWVGDGDIDGWVKVSELEELLDATIIMNSDLPPVIKRLSGDDFTVDSVVYNEKINLDYLIKNAYRSLAAAKEVIRLQAVRAEAEAAEEQRLAREAEETEKRAQVAKIKQALIHEGGIQTLGAEAIAENLYEAGVRAN